MMFDYTESKISLLSVRLLGNPVGGSVDGALSRWLPEDWLGL